MTQFQRSKIKLVGRIISLLVIVGWLSACTVGPTPEPDDPDYAPVLTHQLQQPRPNPGGIYKTGYGMTLYTDHRAAQVGDIITIMLSESTSASKSAATDIKKDSTTSMGDGTVMGVTPSLKGRYSLATELTQNRDFGGESTSDQSNSLSGSIAATVSEVMPNGLLVVRGEKWLTLNRGEEFIRIRGLIRQEDIGPDNTISSRLVADARISYSGTGELADSNHAGWASRFFNSRFWPF